MNLELTPSALLSHLHSLTPHLRTTKKILVAYSGGLDSHVLLHLLSCVSHDEISLRAIYVNHGLQIEADDWDKHCQNICQNLHIPYACIDLNLIVPKGESLEEVARKGRYHALSDGLLEDEILVTAHHQNDQAETLLLQLFRGAGVQGLASMPAINELKSQQGRQQKQKLYQDSKNNDHLRPLLAFSRESLESYAKNHALKYIDDPSNKDTAFDRNFLRQDIMPLLRERWIGIDKTIARAASIQGETKYLLDELAADQLPLVLSNGRPQRNISQVSAHSSDFISNKAVKLTLAPINIPALKEYSLSKQRLFIRYWISQQGFISPSDKKLAHIFTDLIEAADDKLPLIEWSGVELRRFKQCLFIMPPLSEHDVTQILSWQNTGQPFHIASIDYTINPALIADYIQKNNDKITVRFRQGGEMMDIPKRGNISLKNLFQEQQIPSWIRQRLPLIYVDEKLVKIIGLEDFRRL